jgi:hypothetical protein
MIEDKNEKKEPIDFLKLVEGMKMSQEAQLKEALKQTRYFYLELIEAGFTMDEAMAFLAALTRQKQEDKQ